MKSFSASTWACLSISIITIQCSAAVLTHRYPFSADAGDVVGGGNGQLVGGAVISGGALVLNGTSAYVNLPNNLVTGYTAVTIEAWVTDNGSGNWARIFDFGNSSGGEDFPLGSGTSGTQYMFLTPRSGSGTLLGNYTIPGSSQSAEWSGKALTTGVRQHVVWASDVTAQTLWIYVNGVLVASNTFTTLTPAALGNTTNDWIGRSQYNDPLFKGNISDFRVYNGALSPLQVAVDLAAGAGQVVTDPGNCQSVVFQTAPTMTPGSTQMPAVLGNFVNVSNVNLLLASGVIFSSSNPNVVTVNSSGRITAVGAGLATVTASFGGIAGTQTIYVSDPPQTLVHRYSFTTNANDSEGTANGILSGGATIANSNVLLNGSSAFVDLPNNLVSNLTSVTIEAWFTDNGGNGWARLWDFGNSSGGEGNQGGGTSYMFLSVPSGFGGLRGAYNIGSGEQAIDYAVRPTVGAEHHVVWTQDGGAQTAKLYVDGVLVGENDSFPYTPAAIGGTVNDWLGRSQYNDPYFYGSIDEFRIYTNALSAREVTQDYLLGPNVSPQTGPVTITTQPTNAVVTEQQAATFYAGYTGRRPVTFQWFRNGTAIAGATNSAYLLPSPLPADSGAVFAVALTNTVASTLFSALSSNAMLTVFPDTNRPVVTHVLNIGATNVQLTYSEWVSTASATNIANYYFTNGLPVTGASLNADNLTVVLNTAPMTFGSNYTVVINGVLDRAMTPNVIATNTAVSFQAMAYAQQDIGNPSANSTLVPAGNGFDVTAAGNDLGGYADQGNFSYQVRTGNFDVSVRLAGLSLSDIFAKAGLMARENLSVNSRFAAALATPAMNGSFFEWRDPTGNASSSSGNFPANYPNTWLRLQRVGNSFTGFASYDGQTWTQLGSATMTMPSQIFLGFAVSSRSASAVTTAQFRDITTVTNGVVAAVVNPHDAMGPSSRKTPIVFSEIMYKPAARIDGKNLEFVELYNSNPWFQDIGGYQINCADMSYTFPAGTKLSGGGYLVVAAMPADIQSIYGITNVMGPYTGSLKKAETLELLDEQGAVLLTVPYSNVYPWPVAAEGTGHSLVLANATYGEGDPRAWDISDRIGGSPGQMDSFTPSPLRNVVINEFLAHTDPPDYDYLELYNHSAIAVDLSGCILTDDLETNKCILPPGTMIPARGYLAFTITNLTFNLNAVGEAIYFKNPGQTRILDAVQFDAQQNGVATGRWPDGANDFYRLSAKTPGGSNAPILLSDVVINELMYDPISGNDDDQYIELYNRGTNTLNLAGWQLTSAVTFTFPSVNLAPNGYLVIGRNTLNLFTKYPNLNPGNTVGDFSGKLSHNGEYLALTMPAEHKTTDTQGNLVTNIINIVVNDLTYGTGGRWGQWSAGGGSSLELQDPNSNNRLAANWADSNDTAKSIWTNIEFTGVLDNGADYEASILHAQIGLLDVGECLVDNVEVNLGTTNYVVNPTFESGTNGWALQGDMMRSSLENTGYVSGHSLHIRCSDRLWTGDNSCQANLNTNGLAAGKTATLRFKARWLHGWPEALLRLNGNWLEATGPLPIPNNLGTPGLANSQVVTNAGPAIYNVTHNPPVPAAGQAAVVTAQVQDPNGVQTLRLNYRLDPATTYSSVLMRDNGTAGDALAGDGIYSATIPGQSANTLVAFYISATDSNTATSRFPALVNDNAPAREGLVLFGDGNPGGSFGVYHLWISQTNVTRWSNLSDLSNESHDGTMVCGNRVIYNMQARFAGSPYHQGFDYPNGNLCHYKWIFNDDDKFLGATSFNKIHQPGNGAGDDGSIQREQLAHTFLRALGMPWLYRHYVAVYVNGNRRGTLMEDAQTPDGDVVKEHFPNDPDGWLYKMQPWFEFGPFPSGGYVPFNNNSWCSLSAFTTTGGVKKPARYRYNWEIRRTPGSANDFSPVFSLVDAANSFGSPNFVANLENVADMENWMRVFAANHAAGNWDSFGAPNGQNLYGYMGTLGTKYSLLMFDFNISIGNSGSWGPGQNLLAYDGSNQGLVNIYNTPAFLRMYWRALGELVNGPLNTANSGPLIEAKYKTFAANGLNVENPVSNIEPWLSQAQSSIASQLAAVNASTFSMNPGVTVSNNLAYVTGVAPVNVATVWINGAAYPLTWTTLTNWMVAVPLVHGTNNLNAMGVDRNGQLISGDTGAVSVVYSGTNVSPVSQVVINEIMYDPLATNAEFVELYNNSTNVTFDLSGWQVQGLSYTFPNGSTLAPTNYLVLAANNAAFAVAYGATNPVFDTFGGTLSPDGETLTLNTASNLTVAKVKYESQLPWPTNASVAGASLQLIDSHQDNWRVGNWQAVLTNTLMTPKWIYATVTGTASSSLLYIYLQSAGDVYLDDIKLVAGSVPEVGVNVLSNGGFESGLPANWTVSPNLANSVLSTVIRHSGNAGLHLISTSVGSTQSSAIWQTIPSGVTVNAAYTLSFWYLQSTNGGPLTLRLSGSGIVATVNPAPAATIMATTTPGIQNNVNTSLASFPSLWINEVQADNLTGITNRAGQHAAWLELYNPGTNQISLNGLYLANNYTNLLQWPFPTNANINAGQFKVIFADGLTNLSTTNELHTGFVLPGSTGSLALTRLAANGQQQVLDFVDYQNIGLNDSYGSFPDGQSFNRLEFFQATPGAANSSTATPPPSFIAYTTPGAVYSQNFNALPNPGALSVNADNPVTNNGVIYSLANPYDFAFPVLASGNSGGLGIAALAGWYGNGVSSSKFGATPGDQTTGGQLSFGLPNSANRALGLLATSSTKGTAFGARFLNASATTLTRINLQFTGEVWRQSNLPKTLQFYYFVDPTGTNIFSTNVTAFIPALNVNLPTMPAATGGVAVDGTLALNQTNLSVLNQAITNWPSGSALWLVWQMTDSTGKAQGLGIDNLNFSAGVPQPVPLDIQISGTNLMLNLPSVAGQIYQLEFKDDLTALTWTPLGNQFTGTGGSLTLTNSFGVSPQRYFRLRLVN